MDIKPVTEIPLSRKKYKYLFTISVIALLVGVLLSEVYVDLCSISAEPLSHLEYLFPIASLFLFYFGLYAIIKKVGTMSIFNGPLTCIIIGSVLVFISFSQPLIQFIKLQNLEEKLYSDQELKILKNDTVDLSNNHKKRLNAATLYYLESGKAIEYYDKRGELREFTPDNRQRKEREKSAKFLAEIVSLKKINQNRMYIYLSIFVLFGLGFLFLIVGANHRTAKQ